MKKLIALALSATMALSLVACGGGSSNANANTNANPSSTTGETSYPKLNLKISTSGTDQGIDALAATHFAELVKDASGGQITVTVYPNCQLAGGSMPKAIELLLAGGSYEMAVFSGSVLGNIDEKFLTHSVPFIFESYAEASSYMDGTGGEYYAQLMDEKGLVYMSGMHNGLRQLTNGSKAIDDPADLAGLKIRVPSGEVYMKTLQDSFGADAVAMNWSEVFTALQQNTLDGHENGYQTINSANIQEVQKYITEWNWSYDGYWFMANQKDWGKFDEATQQLLLDCSQEAAIWGRNKLESDEVEIKQDFIDNYGVTITELSDTQREAFVSAARPTQEYFIEKFGADVCAAWGLE